MKDTIVHDQSYVNLLNFTLCRLFQAETGRFQFRNRNWNQNWHFFQMGGIGIGIESTSKIFSRNQNWNRFWNRNRPLMESESEPQFNAGIRIRI